MEGTEEVVELLESMGVLVLRHMAGRDDLSLTSAATLGRLHREGPARLTALAAGQGVSQPSMTQLIQRLERQGLVARVADPDDGRAVLVEITGEGRELIARRRVLRLEKLTELLSTLPAEDEAALREAARTILPAVRKLLDNAG